MVSRKMSLCKKILPMVVVGLLLLSAFVVAPSYAPPPTPSILDIVTAIKRCLESGGAIYEELFRIGGVVNDIEAKLDDTTYGLSAIKSAVDGIDTYLTGTIKPELDAIKAKTDYIDTISSRLGTPTEMPATVMGKLEDIHAHIDTEIDDIETKLDGWFGAEGKYVKTAQVTTERDFIKATASGDYLIRVFGKPANVKISIYTVCVGEGSCTAKYHLGSDADWIYGSTTVAEGQVVTIEVSTHVFFLKVDVEPNGYVEIYYDYVIIT